MGGWTGKFKDTICWDGEICSEKISTEEIVINNPASELLDILFSSLSSHSGAGTELYARGTQRWNITNGIGDLKGSINYSTPGDNPGISFRGLNDLGRTDIEMRTQTGGFEIGTHAIETRPPRRFIIDADGNVGVGNETPTQPFSVKEKSCMTAIGGFAIKLTNKTGTNSVGGQLVECDSSTDDAVELNDIAGDHCIGVFLDDGIADGEEAWVVISGVAEVALDDNVEAIRGYWMGSGAEEGYARTLATPPVSRHWEEIGHCCESVAAGGAGTHIKARCILHFN